MKLSQVLILLFTLTGCAVPTIEMTTQRAGAKPTNEETIKLVNSYIEKTFNDPDSVKDLAIYEPVPGSIIREGATVPAWIVCFDARAKNTYGAYTPIAKHDFRIIEDEIIRGRSVNSWSVSKRAHKACLNATQVIYEQE